MNCALLCEEKTWKRGPQIASHLLIDRSQLSEPRLWELLGTAIVMTSRPYKFFSARMASTKVSRLTEAQMLAELSYHEVEKQTIPLGYQGALQRNGRSVKRRTLPIGQHADQSRMLEVIHAHNVIQDADPDPAK